MKFSVREAGKVRIVDLRGRLAAGEPVKEMSEVVKRLLDEGHRHIVLNLAAVDWIDSTALGEMVASQHRARRGGGEIKLVNPSSKAREVIVMVKLETVFEILENELEATGSF